ncbi:hypothetical protein NHQ30_003785 [Ciborinia camelliae]|nr:hypothetical protein NHQ30_003785 [Ciborinia camelliae]
MSSIGLPENPQQPHIFTFEEDQGKPKILSDNLKLIDIITTVLHEWNSLALEALFNILESFRWEFELAVPGAIVSFAVSRSGHMLRVAIRCKSDIRGNDNDEDCEFVYNFLCDGGCHIVAFICKGRAYKNFANPQLLAVEAKWEQRFAQCMLVSWEGIKEWKSAFAIEFSDYGSANHMMSQCRLKWSIKWHQENDSMTITDDFSKATLETEDNSSSSSLSRVNFPSRIATDPVLPTEIEELNDKVDKLEEMIKDMKF